MLKHIVQCAFDEFNDLFQVVEVFEAVYVVADNGGAAFSLHFVEVQTGVSECQVRMCVDSVAFSQDSLVQIEVSDRNQRSVELVFPRDMSAG